jgi:hypothetical protein
MNAMKIILDEIAIERRRLVALGLPLSGRPVLRNELPKAAATMALFSIESYAATGWPAIFWPWKAISYELETSREYLLRSAALLVAAIERLDRRAARARKKQEG